MTNFDNVINVIEDNRIVRELLKSCPYNLLKCWRIKHYSKGEIILKQGQKCNEFAIIINGFAEIINISEDGRQYCQAIYKEGNYLGELEIFDGLEYCCNAVAMTNLSILEISSDNFYKLIERDSRFIRILTKDICKSFYSLSLKASEDMMKSVKNRICKLLIEFINDKLYIDNTRKIIIKKSKISDIIGVTNRSVDRVLKDLKDNNIINVKNGYIYIIDIDKLKKENHI